MAGHLLLNNNENKKLQAIERGIRGKKNFSGSLMYEEVTDPAYKEAPDDRVFIRHLPVPESVVTGGRASVEVHTRPLKYGQEATNIYLVA